MIDYRKPAKIDYVKRPSTPTPNPLALKKGESITLKAN